MRRTQFNLPEGKLLVTRIFCTILCIVSLCSMHCYSQSSRGEAHDQVIYNGLVLRDTSSINKAIKTANSIRISSVDSAEWLYRQTLFASKLLHYNKGIAKSYYGLGACFSNKNEQEKAVYYSQMALRFCGDDIEDHEMISSLYVLLSENYYYKGRYDSCAYYRYAALNELDANHIDNPRMQMKVYCSILQFWLNAHGDITNDKHILQVVQRINVLEQKAKAANDSAQLMNIYFYKGGYYNNIQQNDSARYYCNLNLQLARKLKTGFSIPAATLMNIGITYMEDGKLDEAISYMQRSLDEIPESVRGTSRQYFFANIFLGEAYGKQHNYAKAIAITEPALAMANKQKVLHITDHAYKTLADAYEAIGNYEKAAINRRLYSEVQDSLMKAEKLELVYNVEMKYRIADKDKELAQKELAIAKNESRIKTKNFWIIGFSVGFVLLLVVCFLVYRNIHHKQKLQAEKIRNLRQELQISNLQAVISTEEKERSRIARELHDGMGGTLAAIRTRVSAIFRKHTTTDVTGDFKEVLQLLEEASIDLRKTAHNLMPEILLNEGLAKASELFCERVRKGHMLNINVEIWGKVQKLPGDMELTSYRIIQELVHNIIKHANATEAIVQMVFHESQLCITVEDNGNGMSKDILQSNDGMGLKTIKERVKYLNGQIDIASSPGEGTCIYIELGIIAVKQNTATT